MTTTHTPGPWHVTGDERGTMITDNTGGQLAIWPEQGGTVEQCANARLIAAAPDLLATLRGVVLCADARGDAEPLDAYQTRAAMLPRQIARAYAAIARATEAEA